MLLELEDEEEKELFCKQYLDLASLYKTILKKYEEEESVKKEDYSKWKENINYYIDLYNFKSSFHKFEKIE